MSRVLLIVTILISWNAVASCRGSDVSDLSALIDREIQSRLDTEQTTPAPVCDDATFLRRVHLDLHGVVPSADRVARFLESRDPEKRARLISELLNSPRYGQHFGDLWRGYLVSPLINEQRAQTERFTEWLSGRLNQNDGWDQIAYDLLTASGKLEESPEVTYLIEGRYPLGVTDLTDLSSRYFLGIRLNCAQCHDHPFVDWKQQDYWGMAAFFTEIQTPGRPKMVFRVGIQDDPQVNLESLNETDLLEGFQPQQPRFLGGAEWSADAGTTRRQALAQWMTSPQNPFFARAIVNRLWWHFHGRGFVDPVDDMHSGNSPSHPELLHRLSEEFVKSRFDLKSLCAAILNSQTYQRSSRSVDDLEVQPELFSQMSVRVLSAGQLYDSLVEVLGPPAKASGIDTRLGARYEFCQSFGNDGDPDPTRYERGIPHALRLMNSSQFGDRHLQQLVSRLTGSGRSSNDTVEGLFLAILARRPSSQERQIAQEHLQSDEGSPETAFRELAWALLMSSEFVLSR